MSIKYILLTCLVIFYQLQITADGEEMIEYEHSFQARSIFINEWDFFSKGLSVRIAEDDPWLGGKGFGVNYAKETKQIITKNDQIGLSEFLDRGKIMQQQFAPWLEGEKLLLVVFNSKKSPIGVLQFQREVRGHVKFKQLIKFSEEVARYKYGNETLVYAEIDSFEFWRKCLEYYDM